MARSTKDIQILDERHAGPHYLTPWYYDVLASPGLDGLDHGSQAMGHSPGWFRAGARRDLHRYLHLTTDLGVSFAATIGDCGVILLDFWRLDFHGKYQGRDPLYGRIQPHGDVRLHSHDGVHRFPYGLHDLCLGPQGLGNSTRTKACGEILRTGCSTYLV